MCMYILGQRCWGSFVLVFYLEMRICCEHLSNCSCNEDMFLHPQVQSPSVASAQHMLAALLSSATGAQLTTV